MKAFTEFTDKEIKEHVSAAHKEFSEDFEANTKFLKGDHWQDGKGWAGALPGNASEKAKAIQKIKALFTSQNVMKEIAERHISAVLGKDPEWSVGLKRALAEDEAPKDNEQEVIDDIEAALTQWWKKQEVHDVMEDWIKALFKGSRALLRIYIPSGFVNDSGKVDTGGELAEQLEKIRIEVVNPDMGAVIENKETSQKAGMISFKDDEDNEIFEISYLNDQGLTIFKDVTEESESDGFQLGGHLSIYEGKRDLFLTQQIRQQNKLVNKALTMMNNNVDSGFLERIFLNAQPPGEWTKGEDGEEYFKPAPYSVGPGTTNFIGGSEYIKDDENGQKGITNPSVTFREPVPNNTFVEAKSEAYASILEEAHQKHALISGDATASGESRIQAIADFIMDVQNTKSTIDKAGVWLIETVMYLAFDLSGNEGRVEEYNASFNCRIDPGNIPAELRKAILKQVDEGLLSRGTAMAMLGVDDIDAELAKIDSAADQGIELLRDLRNADVNSATLNKKIIGVIIEDKEWLSAAMEDGELKDIMGEIEDQVNQRIQQQDILPGVN